MCAVRSLRLAVPKVTGSPGPGRHSNCKFVHDDRLKFLGPVPRPNGPLGVFYLTTIGLLQPINCSFKGEKTGWPVARRHWQRQAQLSSERCVPMPSIKEQDRRVIGKSKGLLLTLTSVSMDPRQFEYKSKPTPENQVATTPSLLDLSTELLIEILAYLPPADMVSVQRTCRTIRDIVTGTAYLQYTLLANINRVDDLLPPDFPYSERLELLRCHEQSWRDLQFNLFAEGHNISDVQNINFFTLQDSYLIYVCFPGRGWGLQYGYTDLCSAERNKELRWVHLTMGESQYPDSTRIVFAVDHGLVMAVRFCVPFDSFPECKPDKRVTAVSKTPTWLSWSTWHSLNSRRAHPIHLQQHTLCHSHRFLNSPRRV